MLIKEIIHNIEPGTLIQGLTVEPFKLENNPSPSDKQTSAPRVATLNPDGWHYPVPNFDCPVIRTMFYLDSKKPEWVRTYLQAEIKEKGIANCLIQDPWNEWRGYEFIEFKQGAPIGVHFGEFMVCRVNGSKDRKYNNLYTKVLLIDGRIGFLVLETEDRVNRKAELI